LNNWRRHRLDIENGRILATKLDEYSSAISFRGWAEGSFRVPDNYVPLPVSPARTALLSSEWMAYGLIDIWETPGPI
jgi:hypothetical protein